MKIKIEMKYKQTIKDNKQIQIIIVWMKFKIIINWKKILKIQKIIKIYSNK